MVLQELVATIDDTMKDREAPGKPQIVQQGSISRCSSLNVFTVSLRHRALQLALTMVCGIGQSNPGAYFLRRNLFPTLVSVSMFSITNTFRVVYLKCFCVPLMQMVTSPETQHIAFEAMLLLALLSSFHKSDAANLNPYLRAIQDCVEQDFMTRICWTASYAADTAVK